MNKASLLKALTTAGLSLALVACGSQESADTSSSSASSTAASSSSAAAEETTIRIGASNVPHAEILEFVAPTLEEEGITLDITTYNDYVIPNQALNEGDLDANYFQHIPYLESQIEEFGYDFENAGGVHIEPLGLYSQDYTSLEELPDGATVLVSNNQPDWGRIIGIFQEAGLVTVADGVELTSATFDDIAENPKNLQFDYEYDPALMPTLYQQGEGDVVAINSNFAVDQDINPLEDSIALEDSSSPYANIIAVQSGDEDNEAIQRLVEVLRAEETQQFMLDTWNGAVVPVEE